MSPDRAMPVLVYRNPCCAQDSHPRCQYAGGTNVKLIGVGAEGCAAVGAVQQVGSTMIDEFLYLEPVSPAASTTLLSARSTSLAEAVQGADLAVMIARRETVEDADRARLALRQAQSAGRLVVEIGLSASAGESPAFSDATDHVPWSATQEAESPIRIRISTCEGVAASASLVIRCIRTLTEILNEGLIGTDFDDIKSAVRGARVCGFGWGHGAGANRGRIAAIQALAHTALTSLVRNGCAAGLIVTIEGGIQTLKMRDYKLVMDALLPTLMAGGRFACNTVRRTDLPDDAVEVGLIVATLAG